MGVVRDKEGKVQKGSVLNPNGRPKLPRTKRKDEILRALEHAFGPEDIVGIIDEAMDIARVTRSWRGMVDVAKLLLSYNVGTPTKNVRVSHTGSDVLEDLMRRALDIHDEKVIEVNRIEEDDD